MVRGRSTQGAASGRQSGGVASGRLLARDLDVLRCRMGGGRSLAIVRGHVVVDWRLAPTKEREGGGFRPFVEAGVIRMILV